MRTQIQLPEELHRRLSALAEARELSLAEVVRRATEVFLEQSRFQISPSDWKPPQPRASGKFKVPVEAWRELATERDS